MKPGVTPVTITGQQREVSERLTVPCFQNRSACHQITSTAKLNAATQDGAPLGPGHPAGPRNPAQPRDGVGGGEAEQSGTRLPGRRPAARSPGGQAGPAASSPAPRGGGGERGTALERVRGRAGHRRRRQLRAHRPPQGPRAAAGLPLPSRPCRAPPGPLPAGGCSPREAALGRGASSAASTSSATRMALGEPRRLLLRRRRRAPLASPRGAAPLRCGACALRPGPADPDGKGRAEARCGGGGARRVTGGRRQPAPSRGGLAAVWRGPSAAVGVSASAMPRLRQFGVLSSF